MSENEKDPDNEREYSEFHATCGGIEDPVLFILRAHLYTEYLLDRLILVMLPRGDRVLEMGNLSYAQKLSLVSSFDYLEDTEITALRNLNRVRNRCAHERQRQITFADLEIIGRSYGSEFTKIKKEEHNNVSKSLGRMLSWICGSLAYSTHAQEKKEVEEKEQRN